MTATNLATNLVRYILSPDYKSHYDYFVLQEVLGKYLLAPRDENKVLSGMRASIPTTAPSVCLYCDMVFDQVHYGKLWHGCPVCCGNLTQMRTETWEHRTIIAKLSDVHAILNPLLMSYEIQSLIAHELVRLKVVRQNELLTANAQSSTITQS